MSRIVYGEDARVAAWVSARLPTPADWGDCSAIGLEKDDALVAGVVYNQFVEGNSISMHVAAVPGRRWLTRSFLRAAFRYPFLQLGLRRVTLLIPAANMPSRRFATDLGFQLEGIVREGASPTEDLCIYGLLARECRWTQELETHGQAENSDSAAAA